MNFRQSPPNISTPILFIEKAYKLETSPFWRWLQSRHGPSNIEKIISGDWLAHDGLTPEALDSFCLTLRLLIQDQDGFSIRKIVVIADTWPAVHARRHREIHRAVDTLQNELDKRSLVQFPENSETTNRELFDIIFYGGIAHANPGKRDQFKKITNAGMFSYFVFQAFSSVLFNYRNCIQTIAFHLVQHINETSRQTNAG